MPPEIEVTRRPCGNCEQDYDARSVTLLGSPISLDGGWCPECREAEYVERERQKAAASEAAMARKRRVFRERCGLGLRFQQTTFETFMVPRETRANNVAGVYRRCVEYADNFPIDRPQGYQSLVMASVNVWGVGKTHLAAGIAHRVLDRWQGEIATTPVLFVTEPDLFRRLQATYNRNGNPGETEQLVFGLLQRVPLLIIDDVGKEERRDPSFLQRVYYSIIDGRYAAMLPVVMTANLTPDQLADHFGAARGNEATFDRLREMCGDAIYQVSAKESYRRRLAKSFVTEANGRQ